jgi:hypothetical protein
MPAITALIGLTGALPVAVCLIPETEFTELKKFLKLDASNILAISDDGRKQSGPVR